MKVKKRNFERGTQFKPKIEKKRQKQNVFICSHCMSYVLSPKQCILNGWVDLI